VVGLARRAADPAAEVSCRVRAIGAGARTPPFGPARPPRAQVGRTGGKDRAPSRCGRDAGRAEL